jgi:hypothetical protein
MYQNKWIQNVSLISKNSCNGARVMRIKMLFKDEWLSWQYTWEGYKQEMVHFCEPEGDKMEFGRSRLMKEIEIP